MVLNKFFRQILVASSVLTLSACAHFSLNNTGEDSSSNSSKTANSDATSTAENSDPEFRDFDLDKETLYDLLVAEIAAQRNQFDITLVNYIQQARITRDVEIIKRAINAAQFAKDVEAIQELGLLWIDVKPNSIPAHQLMAFQYSIQKMYREAVHHIDRLIELGGEARVDSLALGSQQLPKEDKEVLLKLYQDLYKKHPNNHEVGYSLALIQRNLKQLDEALETLNPIIKQRPRFEQAIVLKANILFESKQLKKALEFAGDKYDDFPANQNLGRLYASILIENKDLDEAEDVFSDLIELYPQFSGLKLSRALVRLENNKTEKAKHELEQLLEEKHHVNEAHFYLGRLADSQDDKASAVEHYYQVKEGIHFEPSLERATFLLVQEDKTQEAIKKLADLRTQKPGLAQRLWTLQYKVLSVADEDAAFQTLNDALLAYPNDEQLLYARAMTHEEQDDLAAMESDLRTIINNNPKNAIAINALGYTLADKTDRLQEALSLISLALSLKPENPAIIDSMGWVLYRLNKPQEALVFLLRAYQAYPDGEVAAHLGEVLWALGKEDEALKVWQQSFDKDPEHKVLLETLKRFNQELAPSSVQTTKQISEENQEDATAE